MNQDYQDYYLTFDDITKYVTEHAPQSEIESITEALRTSQCNYVLDKIKFYGWPMPELELAKLAFDRGYLLKLDFPRNLKNEQYLSQVAKYSFLNPSPIVTISFTVFKDDPIVRTVIIAVPAITNGNGFLRIDIIKDGKEWDVLDSHIQSNTRS